MSRVKYAIKCSVSKDDTYKDAKKLAHIDRGKPFQPSLIFMNKGDTYKEDKKLEHLASGRPFQHSLIFVSEVKAYNLL